MGEGQGEGEMGQKGGANPTDTKPYLDWDAPRVPLPQESDMPPLISLPSGGVRGRLIVLTQCDTLCNRAVLQVNPFRLVSA